MESKVKVGIDISKATFDVALPTQENQQFKHKKFSNDESGFDSFYNCLPQDCHCIMEASGVYYLKLATYLFEKGVAVSVVNPLTIKYFARMRLMRVKTDKKDAAIIAEYGRAENPPLWKAKSAYLLKLQQLQALLDNFTREHGRLLNQKEAFTVSGIKNKIASKILTQEIAHKKKQISLIENEMESITKQYHQELFTRLKSIPGIGKRAAMMLIVISDGFTKFNSSKELS
jgi:transposase